MSDEITSALADRAGRLIQALIDNARLFGRMESARMSQWIKCSERMPPDGAWVLVSHPGPRAWMAVTCWREDEQRWANDWPVWRRDTWEYWRPLPEPPHD